jgi:hypothetical protein
MLYVYAMFAGHPYISMIGQRSQQQQQPAAAASSTDI